jgi:hypothetical protein
MLEVGGSKPSPPTTSSRVGADSAPNGGVSRSQSPRLRFRSLPNRVSVVAVTSSGNVFGAVGPRRWHRAISALVPVALIAAIVAHALPFLSPTPGVHLMNVESGFSAFLAGLFVLTVATEFFASKRQAIQWLPRPGTKLPRRG